MLKFSKNFNSVIVIKIDIFVILKSRTGSVVIKILFSHKMKALHEWHGKKLSVYVY